MEQLNQINENFEKKLLTIRCHPQRLFDRKSLLIFIFLSITTNFVLTDFFVVIRGSNSISNHHAHRGYIEPAQAILPGELKIGGLFEKGEESLAVAFRLAIERINRDRRILPKTRLVAVVSILDKFDSFATSRKVCQIMQTSLVSLFGPQSSRLSHYARSICHAMQITHFETRSASASDSSYYYSQQSSLSQQSVATNNHMSSQSLSYSINLSPHSSALGRALRDLVIKKNWKTFAILYSEDSSMILIQEILKHSKMHSKNIIIRKARETPIYVLPTTNTMLNNNAKNNNSKQSQSVPSNAYVGGTMQNRPSFKEILKEMSRLNVKNIIIDVPREQVTTVLAHAQDVDMLRVYNSYIFTTFDLHTVDLSQFYHTGTNISAFSIIDAQQLKLHDDILNQWAHVSQVLGDELTNFGAQTGEQHLTAQAYLTAINRTVGETLLLPADGSRDITVMQNLTTEAALLFDGIELLARALHQLNKTSPPNLAEFLGGPTDFPLSANCSRKYGTEGTLSPWPVGSLLRAYMQMLRFDGLTGEIRVDESGYRTDFDLQLYDLTRKGLKVVAKWTSTGGLKYVGNYSSVISENYKELLKNKTLTIVTLENRPYVMKVKDWQNRTGNDRYEGYCIDLIKELSTIRNFKYELNVLEGETPPYGSKNDKGEWSGLIRELIDGRADIVVADLTITYERETVVDFTMPFMSLGIGILVKKPTKASPKLFEFMLPLAPEVWIYLITAFVGVTLFMFMVARFSPYEWNNPHPCEQEAEELSNDFTMKNTLWFTIGCLMQQGCDIMPGALSTRVMAAAWWFFILILVSSYTANLAAFLTVERMDNPIQSADDLAKQNKILYGCLKSGSTRAFFQKSNYTTYARMWSFIESRRAETLLDSNPKGVERVKKGDFAFLMESTAIEYTVERNCDLSQVGSLLDQKGYGIATQQDSPYRAVLSEAILTLQEKGTLHKLKDRWWKEKKDGNTSCEVKEQQKSSGAASELGLDHVGGVFVVLVAGTIISVIICLLEFYWKHIKSPRPERSHFLIQLLRDARYMFFAGNKRPLRRNPIDNFLQEGSSRKQRLVRQDTDLSQQELLDKIASLLCAQQQQQQKHNQQLLQHQQLNQQQLQQNIQNNGNLLFSSLSMSSS